MEKTTLEKIKDDIVESHVWKSIFRHGYEDTPRNRVMMVTANVSCIFTRPRSGVMPLECVLPGVWAGLHF